MSEHVERYYRHVEATCRQSAWARRKMLVKPLLESKYASINALVRAVDGNARDRAWVSEAFKAGHIVRSSDGFFGLSHEEPMSEVEALCEEAYRALNAVTSLDFEKGDAMFKAAQRAQAAVEEQRIARGEEP